jgi:DNA-binding transcriptional MerR regulator
MQIGAFARRAGLSVKALRFYADEGLLAPADVDGRTGYRFYVDSQIDAARRILNLREAGLSLAAIRTLNAGEGDAARMLAAQARALEIQRAQIDARLAVVASLLAAVDRLGPAGLSAFRIVAEEPQFARLVDASPGQDVAPIFEETERCVARVAGRAPSPPFMLIFADGARQIGIPVRDAAADSAGASVVSIGTASLSAVHAGSYDRLDEAEARLKTAAEDAGLELASPRKRLYRRFGADEEGYSLPRDMLASRAADYVTELRMPVFCVQERNDDDP